MLEKLRQILQNLINNAIKFTDNGLITISVIYSYDKDEVEFSVSDTGVGISSEFHETIFDKFTQANSFDSRRHEGAGLGLYIVKKFTELLGGAVTVSSEVGKGRCFTVRIPAAQASIRLDAERALEGLSHRKDATAGSF
jgi:signal transduction histidine kinase